MAIPYRNAKLKSANIFAVAIWDQPSNLIFANIFRLYGSQICTKEERTTSLLEHHIKVDLMIYHSNIAITIAVRTFWFMCACAGDSTV